MSGDNPLLELMEVNTSPSGIAEWLQNHPNIDINSEINDTTVFYNLLEKTDVQAEAVKVLINIPGIRLQRISGKWKQCDIPLIHYIKSYKYEKGRIISDGDVSVLKVLIYVTDDINIGDVNRCEPALWICLRKGMLTFAKALLEADGINAHQENYEKRFGIITWLVQTLLLVDKTTFSNKEWNAEKEELYQLLFHKQLDINDQQLGLNNNYFENEPPLPLFHFLLKHYEYKNFNKFDKLKAICSREDFDPNKVDYRVSGNTSLIAVIKQLRNEPTSYDRKSLIELLDILLKNEKLDVNLTDCTGMTALLISTDLYAEQLLMKHEKVDINVICKGKNKLRKIASSGKGFDYGTVSSIIQHPRYDVNRVYSDGKTDLSWAISLKKGNDTSLVSFFLKNDTLDISVRDLSGQSPLFVAIQCWDWDVIKLLMEHPSYVKSMLNVIDQEKGSFLHYLCMANTKYMDPSISDTDLQIMQHVIHQADINFQDKDGFTPLMRAIQNNNPRLVDIVYFFFSHPEKCDLNKKNKYQQTTLDILNDKENVDGRIKSMVLKYAGKKGKSVEEFSIEDHIQSIQMKISDSRLTSHHKEQLQFMLKSFEGVFESLSSGGELDSSAAVRKKLMDNYWCIVNNVEVGEVIVHLFSKEVITENELQVIREEKTRLYKASKLMEILLCRGERCYEVFIQALIDTYQQHIVDEINRPLSCPSSDVVAYGPQALTFPLPVSRKKTITAVTFQFEDSN